MAELQCGCYFVTSGVSSSITFCPLHKAAPDMLKILELYAFLGDFEGRPSDKVLLNMARAVVTQAKPT